MNISENLQYLRKRDRLTQEELADKLGVSRQSVSKWETGEAYPETDKLISISELFDVSLDSLMREKISLSSPALPHEEKSESEKPEPAAAKTDPGEYHAHMKGFARRIAGGVFLILLGVAACIFLAGLSETLDDKAAEFVSISSAVAVLIPVAGAVFLFVFSGMGHSAFQSEHPSARGIVTQEERRGFDRNFSMALACLVSAIIVDVVFLVVMSALIGTEMLRVPNIDASVCFVTAGFFTVLSAIVSGLVYFGIRHSEYHTEEYDKQSSAHKPSRRNSLNGAIMLTATAIFLTIGFVWNIWHPTWVIFPLGGILCGILDAVLGIADKNKNPDGDDGETHDNGNDKTRSK